MEKPALPREWQMERRRMIITRLPPKTRQASTMTNLSCPRIPSSKRFKRRLIATANSLKKKQQQLRADQDLLADRWTKVLAAEEYELERPSKSYPKCRLLPRLEEEALNLHLQHMMRLIGHLVAATERHFSQKLSPHPDATQIKMTSHRETC